MKRGLKVPPSGFLRPCFYGPLSNRIQVFVPWTVPAIEQVLHVRVSEQT